MGIVDDLQTALLAPDAPDLEAGWLELRLRSEPAALVVTRWRVTGASFVERITVESLAPVPEAWASAPMRAWCEPTADGRWLTRVGRLAVGSAGQLGFPIAELGADTSASSAAETALSAVFLRDVVAGWPGWAVELRGQSQMIVWCPPSQRIAVEPTDPKARWAADCVEWRLSVDSAAALGAHWSTLLPLWRHEALAWVATVAALLATERGVFAPMPPGVPPPRLLGWRDEAVSREQMGLAPAPGAEAAERVDGVRLRLASEALASVDHALRKP